MAKPSAQNKQTSPAWSSTQAYVLALITCVVGIGIGWLLHGSYTDNQPVSASAPAATSASVPSPSLNQQQRLSLDDVNKAAAPMLAQLQQRPNDPDLLARIGNLYYDSQAFPQAIEYYKKSLDIRPTDADVRTDMGTAMFYSGDPDSALKQFAMSLTYNPTHNGTLFNRGVVLMQGKNDPKDAIASWEQLLKVNPNYPERSRVEMLIAEAQKHSK